MEKNRPLCQRQPHRVSLFHEYAGPATPGGQLLTGSAGTNRKSAHAWAPAPVDDLEVVGKWDYEKQQIVPLILALIRELADYEQLSDAVVATEAMIERALFGDPPYAEAVVARVDGEPVGLALYFHTFSTFLAQPGLYLEDLYVPPIVGTATAGASLRISPASRSSATAAGSNGRSSIGMSGRCGPTGVPVRCRWTSGPRGGSPATRFADSPTRRSETGERQLASSSPWHRGRSEPLSRPTARRRT